MDRLIRAFQVPNGSKKTIFEQSGRSYFVPFNEELLKLYNDDRSFREEIYGKDSSSEPWTDGDPYRRFLIEVDGLRAKKRKTHLSEMRYMVHPITKVEQPKCIELDVDIPMKPEKHENELSDVCIVAMTRAICLSLYEFAEINGKDEDRGNDDRGMNYDDRGTAPTSFYVAVMHKPTPTQKSDAQYGKYKKYGLHIRIMVRVDNAFISFFCDKLTEKRVIEKALFRHEERNVVSPDVVLLDKQTPGIPILVYGSQKHDDDDTSQVPNYHRLRALYRFEHDGSQDDLVHVHEFPRDAEYEAQKGAARGHDGSYNPVDGCKYAYALELSAYVDGIFVKKPFGRPRAQFVDAVEKFRRGIGAICDKQIKEDLDQLRKEDPDADHLYNCLMLLDADTCYEYKKWMRVVCAIARTNKNYKCIAEVWSMSQPEKWNKGGQEKLDELWTYALNSSRTSNPTLDSALGEDRISAAPLIYSMAKRDNPEKFREICKGTIFNTVIAAVSKSGDGRSRLNDLTLTKIVGIFTRDKLRTTSENGKLTWYEFVDELEMRYGSSYKWVKRRKMVNNTIYRLLTNEVPQALEKVAKFYSDKLKTIPPEDADGRKSIDFCVKKVRLTVDQIGNRRAINDIASMVSMHVDDDRFEQELDADPNCLGVKNGVLEFLRNGEVRLHQGPHKFRVSRTCYAAYRPPREPITFENIDDHPDEYVNRVWSVISGIFPPEEKDAKEKMMYHYASELDGHKRDPVFFIHQSDGSSGKTTMAKFQSNSLAPIDGNGYAATLDTAFFSAGLKSNAGSGGPEMEKMKLKGARSAISSEINDKFELDTAKVNNLTSEKQSARRTYGENETFRAPTQYHILVNHFPGLKNAKYGIIRRMLVYRYKYTFVQEPAAEHEKKMDETIESQLVEDQLYVDAYFSILVFFYGSLIRDHKGVLKNVKSPTMERETKEYIGSQNSIERFINERTKPMPGHKVNLDAMAEAYVEWHRKNVTGQPAALPDIKERFRASSVKKSIRDEEGNCYLFDRFVEGTVAYDDADWE